MKKKQSLVMKNLGCNQHKNEWPRPGVGHTIVREDKKTELKEYWTNHLGRYCNPNSEWRVRIELSVIQELKSARRNG